MNKEISVNEEGRYAELQLMALDFAREGKTEDLELMLKHGMSVDLKTHKDDTLLMLASYNGHLETTAMVIRYYADLNQKNQRGQTPLEGVCFKGNLAMVKLLVEMGANFEGNAIIYASMFGNKEIVLFLKEQGIANNKMKVWGVSLESIATVTSKMRKFVKGLT